MFFITEGLLHCYSQNQRQIILKLEKDDFFGERALLGLTRRPYPIVAATFTNLVRLSRKNFEDILKKYSSCRTEIIVKSSYFKAKFYVIVRKRIKQLTAEDDEPLSAENLGHLGRRNAISLGSGKLLQKEKFLFHKLLINLEHPLEEVDLNTEPGTIDLEQEKEPLILKQKAFEVRKIKVAIGSDSELTGLFLSYLINSNRF
jgi:cAMP-binding proteins - catabolite gene activator and regulatory subunit of cAMP-dependent protein kinases